MKALMVYYSRTGNTRRVADAVVECMRDSAEVDVEELIDRRNRRGIGGSIGAGKDAMFKRPTEIDPVKADVASYDVVLIGTPVWAFTMCPAVRTFLAEHARQVKQTVFFLTTGGSGIERTLKHMQEMCRKDPLATLAVTEKELKRFDNVTSRISAFVEEVLAAGDGA